MTGRSRRSGPGLGADPLGRCPEPADPADDPFPLTYTAGQAVRHILPHLIAAIMSVAVLVTTGVAATLDLDRPRPTVPGVPGRTAPGAVHLTSGSTEPPTGQPMSPTPPIPAPETATVSPSVTGTWGTDPPSIPVCPAAGSPTVATG